MEIITVVEGVTEERFIKTVLKPHLAPRNLWIKPELIKTSKEGRGGAVSWERFRNQLCRRMKEKPASFFTSMIDLFRLDPGFPESATRNVESIERGIAGAMDEVLRPRFLPYVQRHEFEALVFADLSCLDENLTLDDCDREVLGGHRSLYPTPEDINDDPEKAPGKMLEKQLGRRYSKAIHGP